MFAEIIVIINFVDPLKCVSVARGCKLSQAFYRPFTEENAAEPSALGSPQAFLECRMLVSSSSLMLISASQEGHLFYRGSF